MGKIISRTLSVEGMTCTQCEKRIASALHKMTGVEAAKASFTTNMLSISYDETLVNEEAIGQALDALGYGLRAGQKRLSRKDILRTAGYLLLIATVYLLLHCTGLLTAATGLTLAEAGMTLPMLFVIGLTTSLHCVVMCGGIGLSQCLARPKKDGFMASLAYNGGRVLSYTLVGGAVGALGSVVSFSLAARGIVQLIAGIFMVIMALSLLDVFPRLRAILPRLPKGLSRLVQAGQGQGPFIVGLLNGLMPCGPLQAMQLYALSTGSPLSGALSMLLFGLGTVPLMFAFSAISGLFSKKLARGIQMGGAVLVAVLGVSMLGNGFMLAQVNPQATAPNTTQQASPAAVQEVRSTLSPRAYEPITVIAGIPVRWVIDANASAINGCNYAMVVPAFGIEHVFSPGENVIEFTPAEAGVYGFSCWMGMIRSSITVVEP